MLKFIDTHIHLQDIKSDFAPLVIGNENMLKMLTVSAKKTDFEKVSDLAVRYAGRIIPAFGIHPWYLDSKDDLNDVERYLMMYPNACVGEIGLDGIRKKISEKQYSFFEAQLKLAAHYQRPVIIHLVKGFNDILRYEQELKSVKFVVHGFVKNFELIKFINKCGGYFGLGRLFLINKNVRAMWDMLPKDKVLFETDAPFGVREENYAQDVQENLRRFSELGGVESIQQLCNNAEEFFYVNR